MKKEMSENQTKSIETFFFLKKNDPKSGSKLEPIPMNINQNNSNKLIMDSKALKVISKAPNFETGEMD